MGRGGDSDDESHLDSGLSACQRKNTVHFVLGAGGVEGLLPYMRSIRPQARRMLLGSSHRPGGKSSPRDDKQMETSRPDVQIQKAEQKEMERVAQRGLQGCEPHTT